MIRPRSLIVVITILIFGGALFSEPASVDLTLNRTGFSTGDELVLTLRVNPAGSSYDEYFFIELPDDSRLYIDSEYALYSEPLSRRTIDNPISEVIADLILTEIPEGFYRWWIVYIPEGMEFSERGMADWLFDTATFAFTNRDKVRKEFVAVTSTDFQSLGELSIIDPASQTSASSDVETLSSDPYVNVYKDKIYIINRFQADNIQVIEPAKGYETILQFSTGNGSNPQWISFASSKKAYISRYATDFNDLLIVNPTSGDEIGTIDLTPYSDNQDKTPRPAQMLVINHELFVLIQDIDASWSSIGISKIVVIDTRSNEVESVIPLEGKNPFSFKYLPENGYLYVSNHGLSWPYELSGGIEIVDPQNKASLGILIDDDLFQGNLSELEILSSTKGYVIVSDENFNKRIDAFNPTSGQVLGTVYESPSSLLESIELTDDGYLLVAERYESVAGIMFIDTKDDSLVAGPASTGSLPPFAMDTFHN